MRLAITAITVLIAGCQPLQRDYTALPANDPGEPAIVEAITPVRVETINSSASDRLVPVFLLAGPIGFAAAHSAEGDYSTVNGREYAMRLGSGELRIIRGFAIVQPGDCVLLRRDSAGRYLTPMRLPMTECSGVASK
jgi:hypothetical protein